MKKLVLMLFLSVSHVVSGQSCSEIKAVRDGFNNVITYTSPVLSGDEPAGDNKSTFSVFAIKQTLEFEPEYSLMFSFTTPMLDFAGHGIIISLEDGSRIARPHLRCLFEGGSEETVCKYSVKMVIEKEELELMVKSRITNLRFFAYESEKPLEFTTPYLAGDLSGKMMFYLNCLANK